MHVVVSRKFFEGRRKRGLGILQLPSVCLDDREAKQGNAVIRLQPAGIAQVFFRFLQASQILENHALLYQ